MGLADRAQCKCGSEEQTPEHFLEVCLLYEKKCHENWTYDTRLHIKFWGSPKTCKGQPAS